MSLAAFKSEMSDSALICGCNLISISEFLSFKQQMHLTQFRCIINFTTQWIYAYSPTLWDQVDDTHAIVLETAETLQDHRAYP